VKKLFIFLILVSLFFGMLEVSAQVTAQNQPVLENIVPLVSLETATDVLVVPEVNLRAGNRNQHVRKLQRILQSLGYFPIDTELTENFGPLTRRAITNFQRNNRLPMSGFFGPATRKALRERIKEVKSEAVIDRAVDIVCMKTEVEKRENAILIAWNVYAEKIKTAIETRRTDFSATWSIQDPKERYSAIRAAWKKYRQGVKDARIEWNRSRNAVWSQFRQDVKNCRPSAVETPNLEKVETVEE